MSSPAKRISTKYWVLALGIVLVAWVGYSLSKGKQTSISFPAQPTPTTNSNVTTEKSGTTDGPVGRNGLRAYQGPGAGEVTLEWQRFFTDGENFSVHYGIQSKAYAFAKPYIGYISTYTVKGLTPGTKYYFAIEGIRAGNVSAGSDGEVSLVAPSSPTVVAVTGGPIGRNFLQAKAGQKKGEVILSWKRYSPDADKYHIVYGLTPGKYLYGVLNAIDVTPQDNDYSYTIKALSSGTRYYFALEPQRSGQAIYTTAEVSVVVP